MDAQKNLPLPFNGKEQNGSFCSCLIIFHYPFHNLFLIRLRSMHTRGSLMHVFAPVPSDSLIVLLYRSWLQQWMHSTSRLHTSRHEALFEIRNGYLRRTSVKFNCNTCVVRTCSCYFRLSCSTAVQVMSSTMDRSQILDYTRRGVRRYLKFARDTCIVHT